MASILAAVKSSAHLKVREEELVKVIKSLVLDSQISKFIITVFVEGGKDVFTVDFDHETSSDFGFGPTTSLPLDNLRRRGLLE